MIVRPYPVYKDSGIEWVPRVPSDWEITRIKTRISLVTEKAVEKTNPVALEHIESGSGRMLHTDATFDADGIKFRRGDVLFGKLRPYLAKSWLADNQGEAVGDFLVLRPHSGVYARFFHYITLSPEFIRTVNGSTFGSKMPRASWDFIGNMPCPFPDLDTQQRVTVFLDRETSRLDMLIRKQERLIELLAEKRQAIITQAVTKGLDHSAPTKPSGTQWLGDVPAHWSMPQIGMHTKVGNGSTPNRDTPSYWSEGDIPWLNSSHVNRSEIQDSDQFVTSTALSQCHLPLVQPDSLLVGLTGQGRTRGMTSILRFKATINQHVAYISPSTTFWSPDYLLWFMRSSYGQLREVSDENGSTKGALTCAALKQFRAPLPPLDEQAAIVNHISEQVQQISKIVQACTKAIDLLKERRSALISAAVTGKIDVREGAA